MLSYYNCSVTRIKDKTWTSIQEKTFPHPIPMPWNKKPFLHPISLHGFSCTHICFLVTMPEMTETKAQSWVSLQNNKLSHPENQKSSLACMHFPYTMFPLIRPNILNSITRSHIGSQFPYYSLRRRLLAYSVASCSSSRFLFTWEEGSRVRSELVEDGRLIGVKPELGVEMGVYVLAGDGVLLEEP